MNTLDILRLKHSEYLKSLGYSKRTVDDYKYLIQKFMKYLTESGIKDITDVTRDTIQQYQLNAHYETKKDGSPLAMASQRRRIEAVKNLFRYLIKTGQVIHDPSREIELPKRMKVLPRDILSPREMMRLLNAPDTDTVLGMRDKAILELLYSTGIRNEELRNLKVEDINLKDGELRVVEGKNAKDRIVPIGEAALTYLRQYIMETRSGLLAQFVTRDSSLVTRKGKNHDQNILFVSKNGKKINGSNLVTMIEKYAKRANIKNKKVRPHSIRHTFATHLLKNKANIRHIQVLLGHSSLESTQIYTRVDLTDLKKVHKASHPREKPVAG